MTPDAAPQGPAQTRWLAYDYALIRVVPHVHRCFFVNIGVVLHARQARFLAMRVFPERDHLATLCPDLDLDLVDRFLAAYEQVCTGGADAGPIGLLPPSERFHWLTAPRSAVLQASDVHGGRTADPAGTLDQLFDDLVRL